MAAKKKKQSAADEGPKAKTMYTIKLEEAEMDQLADYLEAGHQGPWSPYDVAYSLFAFKGEKVNVVGYQSGKLVVSGQADGGVRAKHSRGGDHRRPTARL